LDDLDLYTIYNLDKNNKFLDKGNCGLKSEVIMALKSDLTSQLPSYIMSIGTTPKLESDFKTGFSSKPTTKIIVKLDNMFITLGSMYKLLNDTNNIWYALPLYNNKNKRVVNLLGLYGIGMNHGQVPGFKIYKLYTREEINNISVIESDNNYPKSNEKLLQQECPKSDAIIIKGYNI
jgi:hypothetical protein